MKRIFIGLLFAQSVHALTLSEYVDQVAKNNRQAQANQMMTASGMQTARESNLVLAPTLFFNSQYKVDKAPPFSPGLSYDSQTTFINTVGVRKLTSFGLLADLEYEYDTLAIRGQNFAGSALPDASIYQGRPSLTLTQALWGNGFGRSTRAQVSALQAQGLQKSFTNQYQNENLQVQAELTFWQLLNARKQNAVLNQALEQAKRIFEWNQKRSEFNLGESNDLLQAQAALEKNFLDLQAVNDQERELSLKFNSLRFVDSAEVKEPLDDLADDQLIKVKMPEKMRLRTDVKASEQSYQMASSNALMSKEKSKPTLDVYGTYALTGQDPDNGSKAISHVDKPATTVGVRFQMPLDLGSMREVQQGYAKDEAAAAASYQQKIFDEQQDWHNLSQKFIEVQTRLQLSRKVEETQETKMKNERTRFKNGRTTTYQVLMFEQDHLLAQIARIRVQGELLEIMSQMKLYAAK